MVNQFAAGVREVNPTNRVIAGGLAPLGRTGKPAPLSFMKKVLEAPVSFDIWAHHPYTSGGPLHRSAGKGDVTLGNLGEMRTLLMSKDSKIDNDIPLQFWVTEFSWDSSRPTRTRSASRCTGAGSPRRSTACGRPASRSSPGSGSRTTR